MSAPVNTPPSATYASYIKDKTYLILHANLGTDSALDLYQIAPPTGVTTCTVVAENVLCPAQMKEVWQGKKLSILCNTLTVLPGAGSDFATISVSGVDGLPDEGTPKQSRPGGDAGEVHLFVEELKKDTLDKLCLQANGGNGSLFPGSNEQHGAGGKGGNGGKVTFQYRDPARPIRNLISRLAAQKWIDQVSDLDLIVGATQLPKRLGYDVDQTIVDNLSTVAKAYRNLVTALRQLTVKCNIALGADIDNPGPLSPLSGDAAVLVKKVVGDLSKLTAATIPPSAAGNTTAVFNSTISVLSDYIDGTATPSDVSKQAQLVVPLIQLNTDVSSTELAQAVQALDEEVRASVSMYISNRATASIGQANPGEGGPGGYGGTNGSPGTSGTVIIQEIRGDGSPLDLSATQIIAFPDQCRMLLKVADGHFFRNDLDSMITAGGLYTRLVRRLDFVSALYTPPKDPKQPVPALLTAFQLIDGVLTGSTRETLTSVYIKAKTSLNLLINGRDMFGHLPEWAPRLSAAAYDAAATNSLQYLQHLQEQVNAYTAGYQDQTQLALQQKQSMVTAQNRISSAKAQIKLLVGQGSLLESTAEQIENLTPIMAKQRAGLVDDMSIVRDDIQNAFGFDTGTLLEAFATVAMAPSTGFAGATAVSQLYKSLEDIPDSQGNLVDKKLILSDITNYQGSLKSLAEGYTSRRDGTITADDPGAVKVMATISDINKLLQQFAESIPESHRDEIQQGLKGYTRTIQDRNSAILTYNACVQQYVSACTDLNYYTTVVQQSATSLAKIDPSLPAVYYWLTNQLDDALLDCMRYLNYQAHAVRFWGLSSKAAFNAQPVLPIAQLEAARQELADEFTSVLESYGGNAWSQWPPNFSSAKQSVVFHHLNSKDNKLDLAAFKRGTLDLNKRKIYGLAIKLDADSAPAGLRGLANARLFQVRVWLLGVRFPDEAEVKTIHVTLRHSGVETLTGPNGVSHKFVHDPINIPFMYDTSKVVTWTDCVTAHAGSSEALEETFSGQPGLSPTASTYAAVGPFTTWTIEVKEADCPGIDVQGVTDMYLEFWGRSQATS